GLRGLRAAFVECAFPNRMAKLAEVARHMTPALIRRELDKLPPGIPIWIYHVKPQFYDEIADELSRVDAARVTILEQDKTYSLQTWGAPKWPPHPPPPPPAPRAPRPPPAPPPPPT